MDLFLYSRDLSQERVDIFLKNLYHRYLQGPNYALEKVNVGKYIWKRILADDI